ncbi:MAG: hypothetical protein HC850_14405 [Rhodomicrobium sp.]|nr:hypothetical protein [Rhodomicrobium sp.]
MTGSIGFKFSPDGLYASDGERLWLIPGSEMNETAWRLRYGNPTKIDLARAASIIEQFSLLILSEEEYGSKAFRKSSVRFCRDAIKARSALRARA